MKLVEVLYLLILVCVMAVLPITIEAAYDTEILIMAKQGTVNLDSKGGPVPLEAAEISLQFIDVLKYYCAETIQKAAPDFDNSNLTRITPDGKSIKLLDLSKIYRIMFPIGTDLNTIVDSLNTNDDILFAERIPGVSPCYIYPNDEHFSKQWGLFLGSGRSVRASEAWEYEKGEESVKIGIVDFGIMGNHEDLSGKVSGESTYSSYHGTHVAGIAAAKSDNELGIAGVSWYSPLLSADITDAGMTDIYIKIVNLVDNSAFVLNNSWYLDPPPTSSSIIRAALAYAYKMNRVTVSAMGNNNGDTLCYPAAYEQGNIAVGAIDHNGDYAPFSNFGNHIDVVAPGVNVYSTRIDPLYGTGSGTSYAAPFVSGVAALIKSYRPDLDNDDVIEIINLSGTDKYGSVKDGWDMRYGHGCVDAEKAFELLRTPYSLIHQSVSGGQVKEIIGPYMKKLICIPGLVDYNYLVKKYKIEKSVSYGSEPEYILEPEVWGRGVATIGYSSDPNYAMGWTQPVEGTVTKTGCELRTYVYEVWNVNGQHVGWYPCEPDQVQFAYTVLGRLEQGPPTVSLTNPQSGTYSSGEIIAVSWNVVDDYLPGVTCAILYDDKRHTGSTVVESGISVDENGYGEYDFTVPYDYPDTAQATLSVVVNDCSDYEATDESSILTFQYASPPSKGEDEPPIPYDDDGELYPPKPNPFNPATEISFYHAEPGRVSLGIYDVNGKLVKSIYREEYLGTGLHTTVWDGKSNTGLNVVSGIYFVNIRMEDCSQTRKLILLR